MMTDERLLELAADLAVLAGAAIMQVRLQGYTVERKPDNSLVTAADHAAEATILHGMRQAAPHMPVIAEEQVAGGAILTPTAEFWLVDPLDGTREFTSDGDDFTVNIGLVRDGRVVLGVVGVPATDEWYGGIVGHGAWKRQGSAETPLQARVPPPEGLTVVASRHHGNNAALEAYLRDKRVAQRLNFGSSLKFCRIAEGVADLYPRFGRTMEWDTCAAQAVLEAAGGTVCTLDGQPLRYGKPGWENPHFVCTGRVGG